MITVLDILNLQAVDMQNVFLTALNLEKCCMIAGPEFLDEEGKKFIMRHALYGLRSTPLVFRTFLAQYVKELSFFLSEADLDV